MQKSRFLLQEETAGGHVHLGVVLQVIFEFQNALFPSFTKQYSF